jgi:hypothetical protein
MTKAQKVSSGNDSSIQKALFKFAKTHTVWLQQLLQTEVVRGSIDVNLYVNFIDLI